MMNSSLRITISLPTGLLPKSCYVFETDRTLVVGKDATCELKIDTRGVSRKHCQLESNGQGWSIIDLGSTNGISVNGKAFAGRDLPAMKKAIPLCDGDEIGIGAAVLIIGIESEPELHTEILTPKLSSKGGDAPTEMLVPRQAAERSKAKPVVSQSSVKKTSDSQLPGNPMNRPKTVLVKNPNSPNPQSISAANASKKNLSQSSEANGEPEDLFSATPELAQPQSSFSFKVPGDFRNFYLEKRVGVGGMGEVFLARDKSSPDQSWAIKFLKPQSDLSALDRARFIREMEIALNMQHNALIRCVDCGEENGQLFIVMDYCNGGNLHELLKRSGKLSVRRAVRLMDRLLAGVDFAHDKGIVHRDLKPSNILLHRESQGKFLPKISDFGLAKSYLQAGESGMTVNGSVGGSWAYMPKEQLTNFRFVSPQSDVWSLGVILYECLTLKLPRPMEKGSDPIRTILESKIVPLQEIVPDIHPEITKFVMKCLAREPEQRYKDAGAMRASLKQTASKAGIDL